MRTALLALALGLLIGLTQLGAAAEPSDSALIGKWQGDTETTAGDTLDFPVVWDVHADGFDVLVDGRKFATWKYVVDPKKEPKTIDLTLIRADDDATTTVLGIYKVEGDSLTLVKVRDDVTAPEIHHRPTNFTERDRKDVVVLRFKRAKP